MSFKVKFLYAVAVVGFLLLALVIPSVPAMTLLSLGGLQISVPSSAILVLALVTGLALGAVFLRVFPARISHDPKMLLPRLLSKKVTNLKNLLTKKTHLVIPHINLLRVRLEKIIQISMR